MTVANLNSIPVQVYVPPSNDALYKIEVVRSNGAVDDVTDIAVNIEIEDGITEIVGSFSCTIPNPNETFTGVWTGDETVNFYMDYATSATTKRFRGFIEKPSAHNNFIKVTGKSESAFFVNITVTEKFINATCSDALISLISKYGTGFTSTNVESTDETITVEWSEKPFWEAVKELADKAGFDVYVDSSKDFHFFPTSSRKNNTDLAIDNMNIIDVGEFAPDLSLQRNIIKVYGATVDGIQVIYTAKDPNRTKDRVEIYRDDNILTYAQAKIVGDAILAKKKTAPITGEITVKLMATIQPGEQIYISSPANNIPPKYYDILSYSHSIDLESAFITTKLNISKEPREVSQVLAGILASNLKKDSPSLNPEGMENSFDFLYDSDEGSHINTEITAGVLKLQSGETNGSWTSDTRTLSSTATEAYLLMVGETLEGASVTVKSDGVTSQNITNKNKITFTNPGKALSVTVTLSNANTRIDSLSLQYK